VETAEIIVDHNFGEPQLLGCLLIPLLLTALLHQEVQNALLALAIMLVVLWWFWSQLPNWFRKLVRKSFERDRRNSER
jgi:hypothetical protein